jgi:acetyl coenzyme A synthetase (ADP forming)-like protein
MTVRDRIRLIDPLRIHQNQSAKYMKKPSLHSSLDYIFKPRSIAVVGAGRTPGSIGHEVLHNLVSYHFNGMIFPVNPSARFIHSMKSYRSVLEIPDDVDLAVIVVPRELVPLVIEDCGRKGVKGVVMITAGYSETGAEGRKLEDELVTQVGKYGMRLVGPNCMGIINTDPQVRVNATFASAKPQRGNVGFISQSGALGNAILEHATEIHLGLSSFVSVGNKSDISGNDLLEYWEHNDDVKLILMYLESFGNPGKFTALARRITKSKPIIAVKSGRTLAGARAASSHTGALAGMDVATDALFEAAGVLRVNTVEELFDLAQALAYQPIPKGNRVAIMTNAGGPGIMAVDAVVNQGLDVAKFSDRTMKALRQILPEKASFSNPLDMIASADENIYRKTLTLLLKDDGNDAAIVIFVHPITVDAREVANAIIDVSKKHKDKPILCCFMGRDTEGSGIDELRRNNIPVYLYPESAAMTLAAMVQYRRIKERPQGKLVHFKDVDTDKANKIINKVVKDGREWLTDREVQEVLSAYNIPLPKAQYVTSLAKAVEAADKIGYPVVLKAISPELIHKTDLGGVQVDIRSATEFRKAFRDMSNRLKGKKNLSFLVQNMIKGGRETVMGISSDPTFGPLIMFGLGGIFVEVLKDVTFRIHPLTDLDANEMIDQLRGEKFLSGFRGEPPVDRKKIVEVLLRLSQLIGDFDNISEMDINPFLAFPDGAKSVVVDARVKLRPNYPQP